MFDTFFYNCIQNDIFYLNLGRVFWEWQKTKNQYDSRYHPSIGLKASELCQLKFQPSFFLPQVYLRRQIGKLSVQEVKFYPNYKQLAGYWLIRDSADHATHGFCISIEIHGLQRGRISWSLMVQFTIQPAYGTRVEVDLMIRCINNRKLSE